MGTFLESKRNTGIQRFRSLINAVLTTILILPFVGSTVYYFPDFLEMGDHVMLFFGLLISILKLNTLHFRKRYFEVLYNQVVVMGRNIDSSETAVIRKYTNLSQILSKMNFVSMQVGSFIGLILPLAIPLYQTSTGESGGINWPVPFNQIYPFDINITPLYVLVYGLTYYGFVMIGCSANAVDSIFLESCLIVAGHLKILQRRMESIQFNDNNFERNFFLIVKYHDQIYDLAKVVKMTYKTILLPFFAVVSTLLCLVFFMVTQVKND